MKSNDDRIVNKILVGVSGILFCLASYLLSDIHEQIKDQSISLSALERSVSVLVARGDDDHQRLAQIDDFVRSNSQRISSLEASVTRK